MRKPVIAGNWKMFKTCAEAGALVRELVELVGEHTRDDVVVCPPFTALSGVAKALKGSRIALGAQDAHWENQGAFTGEISLPMLVDCGCRYVIIGHSERREHFLESGEMLNRKLKKVLSSDVLPIFCVGETLQERAANRVKKVIFGQLEQGLAGLTAQVVSPMIVAYEPVWAIGTGKTATAQIAQEVHLIIRNWLRDRYSEELSVQIRILYGGSVKPENISDLMAQPDIDGALVGGASLEAKSFAKIVGYERKGNGPLITGHSPESSSGW